MAWTTPRTWVANEVVTAALMNAHVRDNLNAIAVVGITGWTDYSASATWTGTGSNPTYTVNLARYCQIGKLVVYRAKFTMINAGTGTYGWGLPVTAIAGGTYEDYGTGMVYDATADAVYVVCFDNNGGTASLRGIWDQRTSTGVITQTSPFTFAVNDQSRFTVVYEAA